MAHQTFKVSIIIDDQIENFYIKHFVDEFQPIFNKFKNLVFQRNPAVNSPFLKIYWIDAENDKILISCEEDFRLYIEQGQGKKIFFSVLSTQPQQAVEEDEVAMEAEESSKLDRRSRKSAREAAREEEKQRRAAKRLAEKMRSAEEKVRAEEERRARNPEKHERKNAERLERAKKRCEQIRQIIGAMGDPANLNATSANVNVGASTSTSADPSMALLHPSPETIRLLSNAIAGCLQPCSLINKILSDIIGMVPQVPQASESATATAAATASGGQQNTNVDQQQQTEVPLQNMATNTSSFINTPMAVHPSSQEIEALFKEAAKELEKMNEIVKSGKSMEGSTTSMASSTTGITQVERVFANISDSAISNATIINADPPSYEESQVDGNANAENSANNFNVVATPPKSMRSRESSIEVHDENSMISDDSRDWTMLDANSNDQEDESLIVSVPQAGEVTPEIIVASPKETSIPLNDESKRSSVSTETQTPSSLMSVAGAAAMSREQVHASIQASIESVGTMNEIVKNSIASAQESLKTVQHPINMVPAMAAPIQPIVVAPAPPTTPVVAPAPPTTPVVAPAPAPSAPAREPLVINFDMSSASTPANLMASTGAKRKQSPPKPFGPAVFVYDPNPKINAAVHQMMNMGYANEGGWLTQLLINCDGDIPKAINFLTPQPKNKH